MYDYQYTSSNICYANLTYLKNYKQLLILNTLISTLSNLLLYKTESIGNTTRIC
jgi:hypothetical protein